jgi:tetratricopeptide (TPR) repeat protein
MALDRHKTMQSAERLLKQGKVPTAVAQLEALADSVSSDPVTLNRVGDMLARYGQNGLALKYYDRIASQFTQQGFYPKAVAIHKKILRINPNHINSLIELGGLFVKQRLPGEARGYFLKGAELYLQTQNFVHAREVYEQLVAAEPEEPRHRARLAETRAAEGDSEAAGDELLALGDSLLEAQHPEDAEKAYRRAAELVPERSTPTLGIARALALAGKLDEACNLLQGMLQGETGDPAIRGELLLLYERAERTPEALALLEHEQGIEVPDVCFENLLRHHLSRQTDDLFWERLDGVFRGWAEQGKPVRSARLYGHLAATEERGHIPALTRLYDLLAGRGDEAATIEALERLIRAHERHDDEAAAARLREQLRELAPTSAVCTPAEAREVDAPAASPTLSRPSEPTPAVPGTTVADKLPVEAEAPAVPLNRTDEEFVTGRLTQAEILDKYGLREQAMSQLREVVEKFPGHEEAQHRLVLLLRDGPSRKELSEALVGLALARRASGGAEGARQAAAEALRVGELDASKRELLEKLGLLEQPTVTSVALDEEVATPGVVAPAAPDEEVVRLVEVAPAASADEVPGPVGAAPAATVEEIARPVEVSSESPAEALPVSGMTKSAPNPVPGSGDRSVLVDFDDAEEEEEKQTAEAEPVVVAPTPTAPPEVEATLSETAIASDSTAAIDAQSESLAGAAPADAELEPLLDAPAGADDDDDLSTITAALESELFTGDDEPLSPEAESEQSLDDVFAAFREHVEREVDSEDHRTHYDLGIAYKEMGLVEEAIGEFQAALKSPEFARQASVMLAICHRERHELDKAVTWYRQALEVPGATPEDVSSLRYELAEMLLQTGDRTGALSLFRDVMQSDPTFRNVQDRVAELESTTS